MALEWSGIGPSNAWFSEGLVNASDLLEKHTASRKD